MTPATFVLLSGTLTFGVPLALALRELMVVHPSPKRGGDERPPPRHPRAPQPLPECLLPNPVIARNRISNRVLEDA